MDTGRGPLDRGHWAKLDGGALIEDPCLRCPIRVRALLDATEADKAVARALLAQDNPVLQQTQEEAANRGHQQGRAQALREGILDLCEVLAIEPTAARRARLDALVEALDADGLCALRNQLKTYRRWDE